MIRHDFNFEPTYGYDLNALLNVKAPAPPMGFERFWRETYELTLQVPLNVTSRQIDPPWPGFEHLDVWEVEFDSLGDARIGGWLTRPKGASPRRGVVVSHGYGARGAPDAAIPGPPAVGIFPCARGLARSESPEYSNDVWRHVIQGIESKETYCHRFCVCDLFSATSALIVLAPEVGGCIDYVGGSFGGGIGALTIPWESRFRRAYLDVPSFGQHSLRLTMACVGSGESVRRMYQKNPEIYESLKYFDSATASLFTTTPAFVAAALFDPAVPPPGQFAVYNALRCEKQLFVRQAAHYPSPADPEESASALKMLDTWFA